MSTKKLSVELPFQAAIKSPLLSLYPRSPNDLPRKVGMVMGDKSYSLVI